MALLKIECSRDFSAVSESCFFSSVSGEGASSGLKSTGNIGCHISSSLSMAREFVSNSVFSTAFMPEEAWPLLKAASNSLLSEESFDRR